MPSSEGLPPGLSGTRKVYKLHTQKVIEWVLTTSGDLSREPSDHPASFQQENGWQTVGRKGKRRGKGKGKAKAKTGQNKHWHNGNAHASKITLADFTAKVNALVKASVRAPSEILACLANVIKFRKICAAFFSTDEDAWKSNGRHRHAIGVFIDAWVKLGGKTGDSEDLRVNRGEYLDYTGDVFTAAPNAASVPAGRHPTANPPENAPSAPAPRSALDNEWLCDNPLISTKKATKTRRQEVPLDDYAFDDDNFEDGPDAMLVAIAAFFCDVDKIRRYCQRLWRRVDPAGPVSRISASVVTTHAVELVKQLECELKAEFPDSLKSADDIYRTVKAHLPQGIDEDGNGVAGEALMCTAHSSVNVHKDFAINGFANGIPEMMKPEYFNNHDVGSVYSPRRRSKMSRQERLYEDRYVLGMVLLDFSDLAMTYPEGLAVSWPHKVIGDDGFGAEFFRFFDKRAGYPVHLSFVFAAQMVLDVFYIRREGGFNDKKVMRKVYRRVSSQYDEVINDTEIPDRGAFEGYRRSLRILRGVLDMQMGTDAIYQFRVLRQPALSLPSQKDQLWMLNPWLAANSITYSLKQYWDQGTLLSLGHDYPQSLIELWNFLKQLGLLDGVLKAHPEPENLLLEYLTDKFAQQVFPEGKPVTRNFMISSFICIGKRRYHDSQVGSGLNCLCSRLFYFLSSRSGRVFELDKIMREREDRLQDRRPAGAPVEGGRGTAIARGTQQRRRSLLHPLETALELAQSETRADRPTMGLDMFKIRNDSFAFLRRLHLAVKDEPGGIHAFFTPREAYDDPDAPAKPYDERHMPAVIAVNLMGYILFRDPAGPITLLGQRFRELPKHVAKLMPLLRKAAALVADTVGKWKTKDFLTTADV